MICARPGCGTVFCDDLGDYPPGTAATHRVYCSKACRKAMKRGRAQQRLIARHKCDAKERYPDITEARTAAGRLFTKYGYALYPYNTCGCGWYHLTNQKPSTEGTGKWELKHSGRPASEANQKPAV